jgi:hypothetical protein
MIRIHRGCPVSFNWAMEFYWAVHTFADWNKKVLIIGLRTLNPLRREQVISSSILQQTVFLLSAPAQPHSEDVAFHSLSKYVHSRSAVLRTGSPVSVSAVPIFNALHKTPRRQRKQASNKSYTHARRKCNLLRGDHNSPCRHEESKEEL